jgi:type II secretion system protein E
MSRTEPSRSPRAAGRKLLLGELLISKGLLSAEQLSEALKHQAKTGEYLGAGLVHFGFLTETQLMEVLAEQLSLPFVRLADRAIDPAIVARVPAKLATRYRLMPLGGNGKQLQVATSDPFDVQMLDELRLMVGCEIQPVLASAREIQDAIHRHYGLGASAVEQLLDADDRPEAATHARGAEDLSARVNEASVISFVNQLITQAVKERATDVHIEPYETYMRIRQRIDGILYEIPIPPDLVRLHQAVVSRIKVMAHLDIAERRLPQDGRIKVRMGGEHNGGQELDLRVSVLPTSFGEGVDIRILSSGMLYSLESLGLAEDHHKILTSAIDRPHGIIFVTGPTGSGKTTTLYSCLSKLNLVDRKIITIEDPVEYQLAGINQIQVHPKIGLSFAAGLRSVLRHDPDIIMVGEVRDPETAEITIRSALTGHLVFSTLHTNDAAGGVTRLLDMGIEPYLVASSVLCFIAQRLVRVVCEACREAVAPDPSLCEQFGVDELPPSIMRGRGCPTCKGAGFKGRTAIYEFLNVDEQVQQLILQRASSHEISRLAQSRGMRTLRQDGWMKILRGMTTPQEVLRVT